MKLKKLFCIPYAGGLAGYYLSLFRSLDNQLTIDPIELAGRGTRADECLYLSFDEAVEDVYHQLTNQISEEPYYIFGHSMGGLLAYELCLRLERENLKLPEHVFISAKCPPYIKENKNISEMSDEDLIYELKVWGGTSSSFFDDPVLVDLFFPIIRNDLTLLDKYIPKKEVLNTDITVMWGKEDRDNHHMQGWKNMTLKTCQMFEFEGDHFYINKKSTEVAEIIRKVVTKNNHHFTRSLEERLK